MHRDKTLFDVGRWTFDVGRSSVSSLIRPAVFWPAAGLKPEPLHLYLSMIIQIYEIQTPTEAEIMIGLGVDHVGSVIISEADWKSREIKETIDLSRSTAAKSSLIPLYNNPDAVLRTLDYYQPDIVHFCEALTDRSDVKACCRQLIALQKDVKRHFPGIEIMRSIPIVRSGSDNSIPTLELSREFGSCSDYFLTDTLLTDPSGAMDDRQPVQGFVGITGQTCNWDTAAELVASSGTPVILAGGISPTNVAEGIQRVRPAGVDSCTLTNALDGDGNPIRFKKDPQKVKNLIDAAREAERIAGLRAEG
jgi:phosphoribosylanthranilate isomerase